jgi:cell division septum initiation protein DivIVA
MYGSQGLGDTWLPNRGRDHFPDPFCDYASTVMPTNMYDAHRWCEYIMNNNGVYKEAVKRVLSYFITEVEVGDDDTGDDEKKKYEDFLNDVLLIKKILFNVGLNFITYGNAFVSLVIPFKRYLYCPHCYSEHPLRVVVNYTPFRFRWEGYQFMAACQGKKADGTPCNYYGAWKHVDRRTTDEKEIKVKVWSPKEIEIKYDELSGTREYIWKIPEMYKRKIREGHLHYLENANWEVIECIKTNRNLQFEKDALYHMFEEPLAGHDTGGWGISPILANFRQAWYVQVLHRYNEAIAMDFVMPFRVITPDNSRATAGEAGDPVLGSNMGGFMGRVRSMLRDRRRNPTEWFTLPHPIKYQALGGEAKQLAPYELLDQGVSLLLNNIGVPTEMFKGSLTAQAAAPTLRWFEVQHTHLVHGLNVLLCKMCNMIAAALGWEPAKAKLISPTVIDDIQDQMAKLQLMMGKQISQTTGLKALGNLDFKQEQRRILDEERYVQEQQAKLKDEMDSAANMEQIVPPGPAGMPGQPQVDPNTGQPMDPAAGGGGAGGAPPAGPAGAAAQGMMTSMPTTPNAKTTPQEMLQKAQAMAQQMLGLSEGQRQSEMTQLKEQDQALHALVKQLIEDMRQQAQTAGGNQLLQQQFGGGGGGAPPPQ